MLRFIYCYAECHYAEFHWAQCCCAECRGGACVFVTVSQIYLRSKLGALPLEWSAVKSFTLAFPANIRLGVNFINMFTRTFLHERQKSCLFLKTNFTVLFSYKNCSSCAIHKLHLAVLVAICKSQLAVHKKALKKLCVKKLMKWTQGRSNFSDKH